MPKALPITAPELFKPPLKEERTVVLAPRPVTVARVSASEVRQEAQATVTVVPEAVVETEPEPLMVRVPPKATEPEPEVPEREMLELVKEPLPILLRVLLAPEMVLLV